MVSIARVELTDTPRVIDALERDGAVIVTHFTTVDDVETVNSDVSTHWHDSDKHPIDFFPSETRTSYAIFGRSEIVRERWALNEDFRRIYRYFLRTESTPYQGEKQETIVNEPILSTSQSMNIRPGAKAQLLHRDDMTWQLHHPDRTDHYTRDSESSIAALIPGVDFTEANGATRLILGSHLWPHSRRESAESTVCAEMKRGEALLMLGSTVHGGGANNTNMDRILHSLFFCRAHLRPENNMMPSFSREEVEKWSRDAQYLGGYRMGALFLGHSDAEDPLQFLPSLVKV